MTRSPAGTAWLGLGAGVGVLGLVVALFGRVMGPAAEIGRYADAIESAAGGISRNLDGAAELTRTRDLATAVPELAAAYLDRVGGRSR